MYCNDPGKSDQDMHSLKLLSEMQLRVFADELHMCLAQNKREYVYI